MPSHTRLVAVDEFARIPDDDFRYELVAGRVIRMSPMGGVHGVTVLWLGGLLADWARVHDRGAVMTETGFVLATNPDTVRAPDISFGRRGRIPSDGIPSGFWPSPPDLAVAVLSPDDRPSDTLGKVDEYLTIGVLLVWVVDPRGRTVTVYRTGTEPIVLGAVEVLEGNEILPEFALPLRELFP